MRVLKISLYIAISIFLIQCKSKEIDNSSKKELITEFNTKKVRTSEVNSTVNITGRVIPDRKVSIVSEVQGIVLETKKNFEDGERYQKGELVIAVNDTEFRYELKAQKNDFINSLIKSMSDISLDYPDEFTEWNQFLESIDVEKALPALPEVKNPQLRYFLLSRNVYKSYYGIKSKEERLSKFRLYAPFDGSVIKASVDPGDLVKPGVQLGELISTEEYEVVIAVSPADIGVAKIGKSIDLYARSIDKHFEARVKRISENLNPQTQSVNIYLSVSDASLRAGMYLEGELKINTWDKAIRIAKNLVTRDSKAYVLSNNVVATKKVTILSYEEDTVIVQGLSDGDILITEQVRPEQIGHKAKSKEA